MALPAQAEDQLPPGPGRDLVYGKCRTCHDLLYLIDSKGITRAQWGGILTIMMPYGLQLSEKEQSQILEYLATYLGPETPPPASAGKEQSVTDGELLFRQQCASCHLADGNGQRGEFPPLANNPDLFRSDLFPVYVLLNGMVGEITIHEYVYNGVMPSFSFLSDSEIATLVHYIRSEWGNSALNPMGMKPISPDDVARARQEELTAQQVHRYRQQHPLNTQ